MLWVHYCCFVAPTTHHSELKACVVLKLGKKMRSVVGTMSLDFPVGEDGGGDVVGTR